MEAKTPSRKTPVLHKVVNGPHIAIDIDRLYGCTSEAIGVYATISALIADCGACTVQQLCSACPSDSKAVIMAALDELRNAGHVVLRDDSISLK